MKNKIALIALLSAIIISNAFALEYQVEASKKNLVKFISNAPVEDFEGTTNKSDGYIALPDASNLYNAEVYFEVDLNSVDTGIGLRNRHMRENYLHTDKYPFTSFKGKISEVKKVSDSEYDVKVNGDMSIHGVTKNKLISGKINFKSAGMSVNSKFTVKLTDYKIEVPQLMFVKISEEIKLELYFNLKKSE